MSIKDNEFLTLFDKDGNQIKKGLIGKDTIGIDGLKKGQKVGAGEYRVSLSEQGSNAVKRMYGVPGFTVGEDATTTTTTTKKTTKKTTTTTTTKPTTTTTTTKPTTTTTTTTTQKPAE